MESPPDQYRLLTTPSGLAEAAEELKGSPVIGLDTETTALSPRDGRLRLMQLSDGERTFIADLFECPDISPLRALLESGPTKVLHNAKFDLSFLLSEHSLEVAPLFDTMLADQLLSGGQREGSYALEAVVRRHLGWEMDKSARAHSWEGLLSEEQLRYAARDASVLVPLHERLGALVEEERLASVARIEFGVIPAIAGMELAGVRLDTRLWGELEEEVRARRDTAAGELESHFPPPEGMLPLEGLGPHLNINSPQQVMEAFRSIGVDLRDTKEWTLRRADHPAAESLLRYRELQKKLGTYLEPYPRYIHPATGRIHPGFLQCRVPTGRLSCTEPNIQQIPHEQEFRRCFVAAEGNALVVADYSQIELRILAELSGDPGFVEAFQRGDDLHSATAATVFGVGMGEVTSEQRTAAKRINFGLAYGRGARSLSSQLGIGEAEARRLIDDYFASYPLVQKYLQDTARKAEETGRLRTLSGRLRKFDLAGADRERRAEMRRVAMNFPVQGCLSGETRLFEKTEGYVPIGSLVGRSVTLWDGECFSRASVVASGKKRLVRLTLKGGHGIECSPDHRFLVRNNNGGQAWKRAADIRSRERVVLADKVPTWDLEPSLPPAEPGKAWNAGSANLLELGSNSESGEWLGCVASDGSLSERQISLLVAEHEEVLLTKLLLLTENLGHVTHQTRVTLHQPRRLHKLTLSCASLARQMKRKSGGRAYGRAQKVDRIEITDQWVEMYDVVDSETERFAANGIVVHNSSADIAKVAMIYVHRDLADADARLINCIHDELVVECRADLGEEIASVVRSAMVRAGGVLLKNVPLEVETSVSKHWSK